MNNMWTPYSFNNQRFNPYPQPQQQFVTQPVGSADEAKGYPVDPNVMYLFPDLGTGRIYFKRLNMSTGKSELVTYAPVEEKEPQTDEQRILARLDAIERRLGGLYESVSGNAAGRAGNAQPNGAGAAADAPADATA